MKTEHNEATPMDSIAKTLLCPNIFMQFFKKFVSLGNICLTNTTTSMHI